MISGPHIPSGCNSLLQNLKTHSQNLPHITETYIMCIWIQEVFLNCRHIKNTVLVEKCVDLTHLIPATIHHNFLTKPGFCTTCLRQCEKNIDDRFQIVINAFQKDIADAKLKLWELSENASINDNEEEEGEWDAIDLLNHRIKKRIENISEAKIARNQEVRYFRDSQGIFADG